MLYLIIHDLRIDLFCNVCLAESKTKSYDEIQLYSKCYWKVKQIETKTKEQKERLSCWNSKNINVHVRNVIAWIQSLVKIIICVLNISTVFMKALKKYHKKILVFGLVIKFLIMFCTDLLGQLLIRKEITVNMNFIQEPEINIWYELLTK
jgi:hypothetical protein